MANNIHVQKLLAALLLLCGPCRSAKPKSVTIWMVLDGFRSDYWDKYDIPHLKSLANQGVRVVDVKPVFPSSWVPNVASMVTGEYSNKHNIVDQDMFDRETETQFNMSMPKFWEDVVKIGSIWVNIDCVAVYICYANMYIYIYIPILKASILSLTSHQLDQTF